MWHVSFALPSVLAAMVLQGLAPTPAALHQTLCLTPPPLMIRLLQVEYDPTRSNFTVITGKVIAAPFYNQVPNRGDVTNLMVAVKTGRDKSLTMFVEVWGPQALPAFNELGKGAAVRSYAATVWAIMPGVLHCVGQSVWSA